jgi:glycosyltransferase involved in cell wall biosynthesis
MVVLTDKDKQNYLSNIRLCKEVTVIPNPMGELNNDYDVNSKTILSVGLFSIIKRFDRIIPIAKKIFEKHPDWSWVICGDGPERKNLENQISENNLDNKIILTGNVPNITDFYKNAAMFVLTSQMEGLPMVLLEAKAHKLPMVAFDIQTGPSDIIRDNQNGFLIEPYNVKKMAEKINLLIENDELRKQFSDNAVLDSEKFSSERIIEQWTSLITQ